MSRVLPLFRDKGKRFFVKNKVSPPGRATLSVQKQCAATFADSASFVAGGAQNAAETAGKRKVPSAGEADGTEVFDFCEAKMK